MSSNLEKSSLEKELTQYIKTTGDQVVVTSKADPRRVFFLRTSSLPFCGLRRFLTYVKSGVPTERTMGAQGTYYVTVGSSAHEVMQDVLARGGQIYGDWQCSKCKHIVPWSLQIKCPVCGSRMNYQEIEVAWKSWRGHIDGVFLRKNEDYWIIDYKTAQEAKILANNIRVAEAYKNQQDRYVVFTEDKYHIKVKGWCLVYSSRDNMFDKHRLRSSILTEEYKEEIRQLSLMESKQHKRIWKITEVDQTSLLVDNKLCESKSKHDSLFPWEPCPFVKECFLPNKRGRLIETLMEENSDRLPLIKAMPEDIRYELYSSRLFEKQKVRALT